MNKEELALILAPIQKQLAQIYAKLDAMEQRTESEWLKTGAAAKELGVTVQGLHVILSKNANLEPDVDFKKISNGHYMVRRTAVERLKKIRAKNG
jgi:hypothetical protein